MDRRTYLDFPIFGITIPLIGPLVLSCVDRSWIVRDFHFRFMGDLLRETIRILRSFLTLPFPPSYYSRKRWLENEDHGGGVFTTTMRFVISFEVTKFELNFRKRSNHFAKENRSSNNFSHANRSRIQSFYSVGFLRYECKCFYAR